MQMGEIHMNEEQKKRATELLAAWRATTYALHADSMADLLQELVDAPEPEPVLVVETEPGYWSRGHYYEGTKSYIDPTKVWGLPVGTKLYTAPPAPSVPETEPVAYATGYYAGCLSIATVDGRVLPAGTALYAAPPHQSEQHLEMVNTPAPSVPDGWRSSIAKEFPLYNEDGLDEDKHCCEWVMLQERKRLHKILAAPQPPKLSDERILELMGFRDQDFPMKGDKQYRLCIGSLWQRRAIEIARAIEREILGGGHE